MKLVLKVHCAEHGAEIQSEYAYVDLTAEYAQVLLKRREAFQSVKEAGDSLYRLTYWGGTYWFGGLQGFRDRPMYPESWRVDDYGDPTEAFLRQHLTEEQFRALNHGSGPQVAPAGFEAPECLLDATECDMLDVLEDGIFYKSYPKHCDCQQETDHLPWDLVEQAAHAATPAPAAAPTQ
jgi:hypothetical protein